jgi:hypothetical protein
MKMGWPGRVALGNLLLMHALHQQPHVAHETENVSRKSADCLLWKNLHLTQLWVVGVKDRQQDLVPQHVEGVPAVDVFLGLGDGNVLPVLL